MSESICLKCENKKICAMGIKQPSSSTTVTGCSRFEEKEVVTNADIIRNMTDEELARFINFHTDCENCPVRECRECYTNSSEICMNSIREWLKSPADEDGAE